MRQIGFSTGAVAKADYRTALNRLRAKKVRAVELSALRLSELAPLAKATTTELDLSHFDFVSFHAPSRFAQSDEGLVVACLKNVVAARIPIIIHPDMIFAAAKWREFGSMLFIENMDKRKPAGRTARELNLLFEEFPEAKLCFDIGHARQVDPTMTEARLILERFSDRLAEVHMSEVNTNSRHDPLSEYAIRAFRLVAKLIPDNIPIILESLVDEGKSSISAEIMRASRALDPIREGSVVLAH
jgi:hypothetical protein